MAEQVLAALPRALVRPHATLQLGACLQAFCAPETLHGENAYACDACAAKVRGADGGGGGGGGNGGGAVRGQPAVKLLQVARTPRALTLHLKRFRTMGRKVHKLDAHVPFPATLDLAPFVCAAGAPPRLFAELEAGGGAAAADAAQMELYGATRPLCASWGVGGAGKGQGLRVRSLIPRRLGAMRRVRGADDETTRADETAACVVLAAGVIEH
eukprot:2920446-Prymnesium_polylepis.1